MLRSAFRDEGLEAAWDFLSISCIAVGSGLCRRRMGDLEPRSEEHLARTRASSTDRAWASKRKHAERGDTTSVTFTIRDYVSESLCDGQSGARYVKCGMLPALESPSSPSLSFGISFQPTLVYREAKTTLPLMSPFRSYRVQSCRFDSR